MHNANMKFSNLNPSSQADLYYRIFSEFRAVEMDRKTKAELEADPNFYQAVYRAANAAFRAGLFNDPINTGPPRAKDGKVIYDGWLHEAERDSHIKYKLPELFFSNDQFFETVLVGALLSYLEKRSELAHLLLPFEQAAFDCKLFDIKRVFSELFEAGGICFGLGEKASSIKFEEKNGISFPLTTPGALSLYIQYQMANVVRNIGCLDCAQFRSTHTGLLTGKFEGQFLPLMKKKYLEDARKEISAFKLTYYPLLISAIDTALAVIDTRQAIAYGYAGNVMKRPASGGAKP